jgi:hypothetical protein
MKYGQVEDYEPTGDPIPDGAPVQAALLFEAPPLPSEDEALTILSRAGWDRAGQRGRLVTFRKGDELTEVERGDLPYWAAQVQMGLAL